jgi:hypothetical protein
MTGIMKPDKSSRENIELFLESLENEDLKRILLDHIEDILVVGAGSDNGDHRDAFFSVVQAFINHQIELDQ